jgi:hypothetical protein
MKTSESVGKIAPAILKAQKSMGNAVKDSKNPFFKSKFADLNAIREVTIPVLNDNNVSVLQPTISIDGKQFVQTTLLHESGEYIASLTEIVSAKQNDPQAYGSAVSYARRYGLQALMCVGAEDDDGEKSMIRPGPVKSNSETNITPVTTGTAGLITVDSTTVTKTNPVKKGFGFSTKPTIKKEIY